MAQTEIGTFSAAVDLVITRSGKPNKKADIITYVRQTIRECSALAFFIEDRIEDTVLTTSAPHQWTKPLNFRQLEAVRYPRYDPQGGFVHPRERNPGRQQNNEDYFYYAAGNYLIFSGLGSNETISLSYFNWPKVLNYFDVADRKVKYVIEDTFEAVNEKWVYDASITTDDQKLNGQNAVSNWLLFRWFETIVEGGLAKIFKNQNDPRQTTSFALYSKLQKDIQTNEAVLTSARNA